MCGLCQNRQDVQGCNNRIPTCDVRFMRRKATLRLSSNGGKAVGCRAEERRVPRLHLEEATVYAFEFRPVAQSGPA
jgi:hypothetical protein